MPAASLSEAWILLLLCAGAAFWIAAVWRCLSENMPRSRRISWLIFLLLANVVAAAVFFVSRYIKRPISPSIET